MSIRSDHDKAYGNVQVYNSAGNIQHVSIVWFVHKSKHGGKINSAMDFLYVELYTKHDRVRVVGLAGGGGGSMISLVVGHVPFECIGGAYTGTSFVHL